MIFLNGRGRKGLGKAENHFAAKVKKQDQSSAWNAHCKTETGRGGKAAKGLAGTHTARQRQEGGQGGKGLATKVVRPP